jgi:hypothetical protein
MIIFSWLMRRFLLLISLTACICISSFAQININDLNIVFQQDFNNDQTGDYTLSDFNDDWNYPHNTQRQDLVDIVTDGDEHSKYMRGYFPIGKIGAVESGWTWNTSLAGFTELYFSYDLRFKSGFVWVLGGKIPGITGGKVYAGTQPAYDDGFSVRGMWAPNGSLVYYLYHQDRQTIYGEPILWPNFNFTAGIWYNITFRVVLNSVQNSVGLHDGILEGFINGKLIFQKTNINFRNFDNIKIDNISNCSFFGGAEAAFNPQRDEWLDLDNFIAYTYKNSVSGVPRGIQPSRLSRILYNPDINSSPDTIQSNTATPYKISSSSGPCYSSDVFYVPLLKSAGDSVKGCIGFDMVMSYNKNLVNPTGRIRIGNDLIKDISEAGYYTGIQDTALIVSLFLNNFSQTNTSFNGTGQVMAVEFTKTVNCRPGDTALFKVSSMTESYPSVSKIRQVESGTYTTYTDSAFTGSLNFWSDDNPLRTDRLAADSAAVTRIYSVNEDGIRNDASHMEPDPTGNFTYHINNDKFFQIDRDIPDQTDMMPVINGIDAYMIKKVLIQDTTFKPDIYQIIAMDVNMDGMISAGDITQLYKRTMLLEGEYQQTWNYNNQGVSNGKPSKDWLFIPNKTLSLDGNYRRSESYPYDDHKGFSRFRVPKVPINLPIPLDDFGTCMQLSDEGYKAILLGDADGSYKEVISTSGLKRAGLSNEAKVIFDLSSALRKENFLDIPVLFQSEDPVYSLDFSLKINTAKMKFHSIVNNSDNVESSAYFNAKDKTLRLTSNSLDSYNTEQPVLFIRISLGSGSIETSDIPVTRVYINGQICASGVKGQKEVIQENPIDDTAIIYPNPARTYFYVKTRGEAAVQIIDITGNVIPVNITASASYEYKMDIQDLHNGIYLVKIKCGTQNMMKKLIVRH